MRKAIFIVASAAAGSLFLYAYGLQQQVQKQIVVPPTQITVPSVSPDRVKLEQGGNPVSIVVESSGLGSVTGVKIIRNNSLVSEVTASFVNPWPASRKIELRALPRAIVGYGYLLRILGQVGNKPIILDIPQDKLSIEVIQGHMPDLVVSEIILPNNPIAQDESAPISIKIKNQGSGPASIPNGYPLYGIRWSWDRSSINEHLLSSNLTLNPGEIRNINDSLGAGSFRPVEGQYTLTVVADPSNFVKESDETNNEKTSNPFILINTPSTDLIISNMRLDPPEPSIWDTIKMVITVKNLGATVKIPKGVNFIHIGRQPGWGATLANTAEFDLARGMTKDYELRLTEQKAGTFTWLAKVDYWNLIVEANENNNEYTFTATIREK